MNSMSSTPLRARNRGRWVLLALFAMFFGSMLGAGVLRFSGWQPAINRNHGQLLSPPVDLRALPPRQADGQAYDWNPAARRWRILLAPAADCTPACVTLSQDLGKVWQLFGHNADNVEILWLGTPPAAVAAMPALRVLMPQPALREQLPGVDDPAGIPVYVVDPNGFVILRYAPGFTPGGLRADLAKLLKLK
ncbi:hypothetical protein [Stenotrophomonas sp. YIM B06876]|uniref:hypothetical protein n=1 Tax=Stenotrophomonas sp. YIM B06876 TaxID=3060211 RepID=UPI0027388E12|nr:hypothetical protein [Stenotrophomonas sp. YIM B06876]